MTLQVTLLSEGRAAGRADVRSPFIIVRAPMTRQASPGAETLVADVAGVRLAAGVYGNVLVELLPSSEATIAQVAAMRQELRVVEPVHVQGGLLLERAAADLAHVGPLAGVSAPVLVPRRPRRQTTPAHVAREVLRALVDVSQVPVEAGSRAEALLAHGTDVGPRVRVHVAMDQQIVRTGENLAALLALVTGASVVPRLPFRASRVPLR